MTVQFKNADGEWIDCPRFRSFSFDAIRDISGAETRSIPNLATLTRNGCAEITGTIHMSPFAMDELYTVLRQQFPGPEHFEND